jgi:hyperosmotically inducible periplasmic protein
MSLVRVKTLGALAAAAVLVAVAGCQRADERASVDRDLGARSPSRAAQEVARRDPAAVPSTPERKRELPPMPAKPTAAAAPSVSQRAPASADSTATRTMGGPPAAGTQTMGAAPARVDDASITRQVSAAIAADQQLRAVRVDVDTQNGIVTLSGPAPTATAKEHAAEVARTIQGVISVNNQLTLASG